MTPCRYDQPVSQPSVMAVAQGETDIRTSNLWVYLRCGSHRACFLTRYSQRDNALLEQRLLAMEQRFLALEQGSRSDKPSPESTRSGEVRAAISPAAQRDQQPEITRELTGPSDQDDAVDGMGAVALKDGADEEEYFGESFP